MSVMGPDGKILQPGGGTWIVPMETLTKRFVRT